MVSDQSSSRFELMQKESPVESYKVEERSWYFIDRDPKHCPVVCYGFFSPWMCHVDLSCRMLWLLFLMKVSCGPLLSYVMASFPHEGVMWICPVVCYGFFPSWMCHVDLSCRMLWLVFLMKVSCGPVLAYVMASFPHEGVMWTCPVVCYGFFSSWRCHVDLSCRMLWLLFLMKVSWGPVLS